MARLRRPLLTSLVVAFSGVVFSACGGSDGLADAKLACVKVERGIALEVRADAHGVAPATRALLQQDATSEVLSATGDAARANSANGTWNALMTTIGQAGQVPLTYLEPSLSSQCHEILGTTSAP